MFKFIKEWLFQYTYTKYLIKLNKDNKAKVFLHKTDQLAILKLLRHLGAKESTLIINHLGAIDTPKITRHSTKEIFHLNLFEMDINSSSISFTTEKEGSIAIQLKPLEQYSIYLSDLNTMIFEIYEKDYSNSYFIRMTVPLPVTLNKMIEESKRLAKREKISG